MEFKDIQSKVIYALLTLKEKDIFLLENEVNERTISHKLAEYLQTHFLPVWDVDCEYNRNHDDVKRLNLPREQSESNDTIVIPDIIIHKRNTDKNLLVIEIKKDANEIDKGKDITKINAFIRELNYQYGLFINFKTGQNLGIKELIWFDKYEKQNPVEEISFKDIDKNNFV